MLATACALRRPCPLQLTPALLRQPIGRPISRSFQSSATRMDEQFSNHYETLGVQPDASDKDIKKHFYSLSKSHHPDLHPNDPDASKRFVRISEAYAVLSAPTKRASYDRDYARAYQRSNASQGPAYPSGSFSSAAATTTNGPGGRPASGLSRRRTQFRGPPPSFYQSGGWGAQGPKRAEHASKHSHAWESGAGQGADDSGRVGAGQGMPGIGPGGFAQGLENDVPHFNSQGHYQTHSTIERTRHRARRRVARAVPDFEEGGSSNGAMLSFVTISGILMLGIALSHRLAPPQQKPVKSSGAAEETSSTG